MHHVTQMKPVRSLDQGSLLAAQSLWHCHLASNSLHKDGKTVLQNCEANTKEKWLGLRDSPAQKAVQKATDTWWPGKFSCHKVGPGYHGWTL